MKESDEKEKERGSREISFVTSHVGCRSSSTTSYCRRPAVYRLGAILPRRWKNKGETRDIETPPTATSNHRRQPYAPAPPTSHRGKKKLMSRPVLRNFASVVHFNVYALQTCRRHRCNVVRECTASQLSRVHARRAWSACFCFAYALLGESVMVRDFLKAGEGQGKPHCIPGSRSTEIQWGGV